MSTLKALRDDIEEYFRGRNTKIEEAKENLERLTGIVVDSPRSYPDDPFKCSKCLTKKIAREGEKYCVDCIREEQLVRKYKKVMREDDIDPDDSWGRTVKECNRARREGGMQERPVFREKKNNADNIGGFGGFVLMLGAMFILVGGILFWTSFSQWTDYAPWGGSWVIFIGSIVAWLGAAIFSYESGE